MKFSVVIPAYNSELYIDEAIASVTTQLHRDWELIIINDGSNDNTLEICENYAAIDERVIVINKQNEGVSAARNDGILSATGDYVLFLDADDKLGDNIMQDISNEISILDYKPDVIFGTYERYDEHTCKRTKYMFDFGSDLRDVHGLDIWKTLYIKQPVFSCPIMTQIYRTALLKKEGILFDTALFVSEDHDWRYLLFTKSYNYYYCCCNLFTYYYRESNSTSVTHSPMTYRKFSNSHAYLKKWFDKANDDNTLVDVKDIILGLIGEDYANKAINIMQISDPQERRAARTLFIKDDYILRKARYFRYRLSNTVYFLFGIHIYLFALGFRNRIKDFIMKLFSI